MKKKKIRRTRWEDEQKNRVTTRTSWRQWGSELSSFLFLSTDIVFFIILLFFLYRPIFIFRLESDIFPVMTNTIRFGPWQLHFSLIFPYSMTGWTGLRLVRFFRLNPGLSSSLRTHVYPIFGFSDRTVRFGPNFKTFVEMVSITLIIISICKFFVKNFLIVLAFF